MDPASLALGLTSAVPAGVLALTGAMARASALKSRSTSTSLVSEELAAGTIGVTELYNGGDRPEFDVILVHSLIGGPETTWSAGSKCWPRDFLPNDFEHARVLSFSYSGLLNSQTPLSVEALGQLLLRTIAVNRNAGSASRRPLVFIAHGIGGLIVKAALLAADSSILDASKDVLLQTTAVCFFGTPSIEYSDEAAQQAMESQKNLIDSQPSRVSRQINPTFNTIRSESRLHLLSITFKDLLKAHQIMVATFFETRSTMTFRGPQMIVPRRLAQIGMSQESVCASDGNHLSLVKFEERSHRGYRELVNSIARAQARMVKGPPSLLDIQLPWAVPLTNDSRSIAPDGRTVLEKEELCLRRLRTSWLEPSMISEPYADTCDWVLEEPAFQAWLDQTDEGQLVITGRPGSGKSVLARYLFTFFQQPATSSLLVGTKGPKLAPRYVLEYFFDQTFPIRRSFNTFLRALIYQLLAGDRALFKHVYGRTHLFDDGEIVTAELRVILDAIFDDNTTDSSSGETILLVDSLDECGRSDQAALQTWLNERRHCKVVITSRTDPKALNGDFRISLDSGHNYDSVQKYVDMMLGDFSRRTPLPNDLRKQVAKDIIMSDPPNFLRARLAIQRLRTARTVQECRAMLSSFPKSSIDALSGYLQDFRGDRALLVRTLYLTANAFAPLSSLALSYLSWWVFQEDGASADSVGHSGRAGTAGEEAAIEEEPADRKSDVGTRLSNIMDRIVWDFDADLRNFSPLIDIRQGRVTLIHASVKDFLDNGETFSRIQPFLGSSFPTPPSTYPEMNPTENPTENLTELEAKEPHRQQQQDDMRSIQLLVHGKMAVACLEYMFALFEDRERGPTSPGIMDAKKGPKPVYRDQLSFLKYAAAHWRDHASHSREPNTELRKLVDELFDPQSSKYSLWRDQVLDSYDYLTNQSWPDESLREEPGVWAMANYCALDLCHVLEPPRRVDMGQEPDGFRWELDTFLQLLGLAAANGALYSIGWLLAAANLTSFTSRDAIEASLEGPMCEAARHGRLESLLRLLEYLEEKPTFSCRLHEAARDGGHDEIFRFLFSPEQQQLVDQGWTRQNFVPLDSRTDVISALKTAITLHHPEAEDYLLDQGGLDCEALENEGIMSWVVEANNPTAFRKLLGVGVDVHAEYNGEQPIHVASRLGREEILEMILSGGKGGAAELGGRAAEKSKLTTTTTTTMPLQLDVDAVVEKTNMTPLQLACQGGFASVCKQLLEAGAAVNPRDKQGFSAAHYAACSGNDIIVSMLVRKGANINVRTREGETPLHMAVRQERESVVEALLEIGSDMGLSNKQGETALHLAVKSSNPTLVRLLLDHGAIVDVKDVFGRTPLHLAAQGTSDLICKELLHAGAYINPSDHERRTPLDYSMLSPTRIEAISMALREAGGFCNVRMPKDDDDDDDEANRHSRDEEAATTIPDTEEEPKGEKEPDAPGTAETKPGAAESRQAFFLLPATAWMDDTSTQESRILGAVVKNILKPLDEYAPRYPLQPSPRVEERIFDYFNHDSSQPRRTKTSSSSSSPPPPSSSPTSDFSFQGNVQAGRMRIKGVQVRYKRLADDHQDVLRRLMSDASVRATTQRWTSKSRFEAWPTCLVVGILIGRDVEISYTNTQSVGRAAAALTGIPLGPSAEQDTTTNRSSTVRVGGSKIFALQLKRIAVRGILRKELELKSLDGAASVKSESGADKRKDDRFAADDLKRRGSARDFKTLL